MVSQGSILLDMRVQQRMPDQNMSLVLSKLKGIKDRRAYFKTIIAYIDLNQTYLFEGRIDGTILEKPEGEKGFGYDPIFQPNGHLMSFAQMDLSLKSSISHRFLATQKFHQFLKNKK